MPLYMQNIYKEKIGKEIFMIDSMTKFYAFIGKKVDEAGSWEQFMVEVDTDSNNFISKDEMKTLLSNEEDYNEQLFNQFWKGLDTITKGKINGIKNKNNLFGGELAKLELLSEKALIAQECLDEYNSDDIPSQISSVVSIEKIKTSVMNSLNINSLATKTEEQIEALIDNLFNQCCSDAFLDEIYPSIETEFKDQFPADYHLDNDNELKALISNYLSHTDAGIEAILDDIKRIIRNYLAQAGIGNAPNMEGLEDYTGPASTATKDFSTLQKAQLEAKFTNALNINNLLTFSIPDQYKTQLQDLIDGFIKGVLNGDLDRTFAYIMSKDDAWVVQKLKASEEYQKLEVTFKFFDYDHAYANKVQINGKDVSIGNMFKKWFGLNAIQDQAEMNECMQFIMESKIYQNIVAAAYKKYQDGEITSEADLYTEIGKQVMLNLAQIMSDVGQSCEIVEQMLYNSFDAAKKGLFGGPNGDQALGIKFTTDELRTLYKQYIDLLKSWKNGLSDSGQKEKLQKIISELESDSYPGRFLQNIQTAHDMIADLNLESSVPFEAAYSVTSIDGITDPFNVTKGMNDREIGTLTPHWKDDLAPDIADIEYKVTCGDGITVKISQRGNISVTVPDTVTADQVHANFELLVNGEVVHSGAFLLNIEQVNATPEVIQRPSGLSGPSLLLRWDDGDKLFSDMTDDSGFVQKALTNYTTNIGSKLAWKDEYKAYGVTQARWEAAANTLKNYVEAILKCIAQFNWNSGSSIALSDTGNVDLEYQYYDEHLGHNVSLNDDEDYIPGRRARCSDYLDSYSKLSSEGYGGLTSTGSGFKVGCNYDAWSSNVYYVYVDKSILWNKFLNFLHLD